MKKLIITCGVVMLLLTMISCSNSPDTVLGSDSSEQIEPEDRAVSAKATETGYAEKPQKAEIPDPETGP